MTPTTRIALIIRPAEKEPFEESSPTHGPSLNVQPDPTDVLVKLVSVAFNTVDAFIQTLGTELYPYIPGFDGAGTVEAVGAEVTNAAKGDKILVQGTFNNLHTTFREYTLQPAEHVATIPHKITFDQAATVSLCLATVMTTICAHDAHSHSIRLTPPWEEGGTTKYAGQAALVLGGGTNVGQYEGEKRGEGKRVSHLFRGHRQVGREVFRRVTGWFETGAIVGGGDPGGLAGIPAGCERMMTWDVGAKLVVRVDETP